MLKVTFDLCTYTLSKKELGKVMLTTKYSSFAIETFKNMGDVRLFAKGLLTGYSMKYKYPAVRMNVHDETTQVSFTEQMIY